MNDSLLARYTVKRGSKNSNEMGKITALNGEPELDLFEGDQAHCNKINGTDRTIFPGYQKDDELVWSYVVSACRSVVFRRQGHRKVSGIKTTYKSINFQDEAVSLDDIFKTLFLFKMCSIQMPLECNINQYQPGGTPKGSLDLYPCLEIFMLATAPHFYLSEESLQHSIEGVHPNKDLHDSGIYFDLVCLGFLVHLIINFHIF